MSIVLLFWDSMRTIYPSCLQIHWVVYAVFPLSCDPLRMPQLALGSWSWDFFEIAGLDTKWYDSIRSYTICCAWMRYHNNYWSFSGDTICQDLVSCSDTITYIKIGLSRPSPRRGLDLAGSYWSSFQFGTIWHLIHSTRTDTLCNVTGYDWDQDCFHHHDRG